MGVGSLFRKKVTVAEKVERIRQYFESDRVEALQKAAENICTLQTLRNLVSSKAAPENSTTVKNGNLDRIIERLPPIEIILHYEAYRGFLKEMNLDEESQKSLESLRGSYLVRHNIPDFPLKKIHILVQTDPYFPVFIFVAKYKGDIPSTFTHDGFAMMSSSTLILFGISKRFITNFYLNREDDGQIVRFRGDGLIFDKETGRHPSSEFTLIGLEKHNRYPEKLGI